MTFRLATLLIVPAMCMQAGSPSRSMARQEPLAMGAKLWIKQVDGRVDVQGWDKPEVSLVADFYDGSRNGKPVPCELKIQKVSEGLEVEVLHPRSGFVIGFYHSPKCNLTLKVPRDLNLAIRSVDGDTSVRDLKGYFRCASVDGDIQVEDMAGQADLQAVDGKITARNLKARLKAHTVDGNIHLDRVEGGLDLSTVDGDIEAGELDGWGEGISMRTVDGKLDVRLGQAKGELDVHTRDGHILSQLKGVENLVQKEHTLRGILPGRTQPIQLSTHDGNIRLQ